VSDVGSDYFALLQLLNSKYARAVKTQEDSVKLTNLRVEKTAVATKLDVCRLSKFSICEAQSLTWSGGSRRKKMP